MGVYLYFYYRYWLQTVSVNKLIKESWSLQSRNNAWFFFQKGTPHETKEITANKGHHRKYSHHCKQATPPTTLGYILVYK